MSALSSLRYFDVSGNQLSTWGANDVSGLANIRYLNLADNPIVTVECGAFDGVSSALNFLNMSRTTAECGIIDNEVRCDCRALGGDIINGLSHCDPAGCSRPVTQVSQKAEVIQLSSNSIGYVARSNLQWSIAQRANSEYLQERRWAEPSNAEASSGGVDTLESSPAGTAGTIALIVVGSIFLIAAIVVVGERYKVAAGHAVVLSESASSADTASQLGTQRKILRQQAPSGSTQGGMMSTAPGIFIDMHKEHNLHAE